MASTVIEKLLIEIEASAAQLQAELAKAGGATKAFGQTTKQVEAAGDGLGRRYTAAAVQIASAAESMARSGRVAGDGLKQIINQGAQAAFFFGPQGALVGAIGIAGLAIVEIFRRSSSEAKRAIEEVNEIARRSSGGVTEAAARVSAIQAQVKKAQADSADIARRGVGAIGLGRTGAQAESERLGVDLQQLRKEETEAIVQAADARQQAYIKELTNLRSVIEAGRASSEEKAKAKDTEKKLRGELALTNITLAQRVNILRALGDLERPQAKQKTAQIEEEQARRFALEHAAEVLSKNPLKVALIGDIDAALQQIRDAEAAGLKALAEMAGDVVTPLRTELDAVIQKWREFGASEESIARITAPLQAAVTAAEKLNGAVKRIEIPDRVQQQLTKGFLTPEEAAKQRKQLDDAKDAARSAAVDFANTIATIGTAVTSLAQAFGALDESIAGAVRGLSNVAAGILKIASGKNRVEGLVQTAGGIADLVAQPFIKRRQRTEERRANDAANAASIGRLQRTQGDLIGLAFNGGQIASITSAVAQLLKATGDAGGFRKLRGEGEFFEALGIPFAEVDRLAKALGITLDGTKQSYQKFQQALTSLDLQAFTDTFKGQLRKFELEARIDPDAFRGVEGIKKFIAVLTGPQGAPALAEALSGLDLSSTAGMEEAITRLKALLANVGDIDVAALGGLEFDEFTAAIVALIEKLRDALPKTQSASEKFAAALEMLDLQLEFGVIDAGERLRKAIEAFTASFGDVAADIDFSSADAFRASIARVVDAFDDDGVITDQERAIIEALRALGVAFDAATPPAEAFMDAIDLLTAEFRVFATSAAEQARQLAAAFVAKGGDFAQLDGILDGIDLGTEEGIAALRARIGGIIATLSAGGVTAAEQAVIDALLQILGAAEAAAQEAGAAAAQQVQEQAEKRRRILSLADARLAANDITDPVEQLRVRVEALTEAFPGLRDQLAAFDVTTQAGRDALEAFVRTMVGAPTELEAMATQLGISVDELLQALLNLEDGADAAATRVATLAEQLAAAFQEVDFALDLEGVTDPLERLVRTAQAAGAVDAQIQQALGTADLRTAAGRAAAEAALVGAGRGATDAAQRDAILRILTLLRGIPVEETVGAGATAAARSARARDERAFTTSVAAITETTANRLVDLFLRNVVATEAIAAHVTRGLSTVLGPTPTIPVPPLPGLGGGRSGVVVQLSVPITINGNVVTTTPQEFAQLVGQQAYQQLSALFAGQFLQQLQRTGRPETMS